MASSSVDQVVTIQEAASLYCVCPGTIRYHLERGNLIWRKAGGHFRGLILIDVASLVALWGSPKQSLRAS